MFFIFLVYLVTGLPTFYHTTEQIESEIDSLLQHCHLAQKRVHQKSGISIIHFNPHLKKKAFIIFGEHPRELITAETGLNLLRELCQREEISYNLELIINMNPKSRKYVEQGHYCLRENQNGVDLSRNYDFQWRQLENQQTGVSTGKYAFSEPETQIVRNILEEFKPQLFITVHSGSQALLTPWAYKMNEEYEDNEELQLIKDEFCRNCLIGGAATINGYKTFGNSIDYAHGVAKVKRAYSFEIYSLQSSQNFKEPESNFYEFLQLKNKNNIRMKDLECFKFYNPSTQTKYEHTIRKWSNIFLELLE